MPACQPVPLTADVRRALAALRRMLDGEGPLLLPYGPGEGPRPKRDAERLHLDRRLPAGVAVATSGSTGTPKRAILPTAALRASAEATHEVLGGPGRWLLALPPHHIAGLQVVLRSLLAGHEPARGPVGLSGGGFTAAGFVRALEEADGPRPRYVSLVPTQLDRLLDDPAGSAALATFDAVLVGGAATRPELLQRARGAGVRVVITYGMSETAGGCVYDGVPLPGVAVRLERDEGRIELGGATVADGYLGVESTAFTCIDDVRWFRTGDLGRFAEGRLEVCGRADDVIVTGGLKVAAHVVAEAVSAQIADVPCVVVGLPDRRWGEVVTVVFVASGDAARRVRSRWPATLEALRAALPAHAVPRRFEIVPELPLRGPGKPDLDALRAALTR